MAADLVPLHVSILDDLARHGVDVARVLRTTPLVRSRFDEDGTNKALLTTQEFFAFWRAIEEVSDARDIGLRVGAEASPERSNVAFIAALHAPTFGGALEKLGRYKRVTCPEDLTIEIARGEARLELHWLLAEAAPPALVVDRAFTGILALARRGTGKKITPLRLDLTRKKKDEALIARYFQCEICFERKSNRLVFDERTLALPFVTRDADVLEVLLPGLEAQLEKRGKRSLADDVRAALVRRIGGERPRVEEIAKELRLSARTLQRRLEEAKTSYQAILDNVRRQSARRLLADTDVDSREIAFLLGFEEVNSFARAFQQWEGTTPLRWRAKVRGHSRKSAD